MKTFNIIKKVTIYIILSNKIKLKSLYYIL